jgi:hypothetical protein
MHADRLGRHRRVAFIRDHLAINQGQSPQRTHRLVEFVALQQAAQPLGQFAAGFNEQEQRDRLAERVKLDMPNRTELRIASSARAIIVSWPLITAFDVRAPNIGRCVVTVQPFVARSTPASASPPSVGRQALIV